MSREERVDRGKRSFQSEKLQKRIETGRKRSNSRAKNVLKSNDDLTIWLPKDGDHIIDLIPYLAGKHDPLTEKGDPTYTFEYFDHPKIGPGQERMICLQETYNKPCPICEHRQKMREEGVEDKIWKELFPKRRTLYNIICYDKGEEKKGIQIWDVSWHYFEKFILAIAKKPSRSGREGVGKSEKTVNFADPYRGKSISFKIEPAKSKDDYPKFIGHSFEDRDYEIENLDEARVLDGLVHIPDYEEVKKAYWAGTEDGEDNRHGSKKEDDNEEDEGDLLTQLEDIETFKSLKKFVKNNDLDVDLNEDDSFEENKELVSDTIEENESSSHKSKKAKDEDEDDDEEPRTKKKHRYDEEDEEEDPKIKHKDEDEEEKPYPTKKEIRNMSHKQLVKLIDKEDLDIDPDDFDDDEELVNTIIKKI